MQLDIFEHSHDVMLRGDVVGAIERRDAVAARSAWHTLRGEFNGDECLPSLDVLVAALENVPSTPFPGPAAVREARLDLQQRVGTGWTPHGRCWPNWRDWRRSASAHSPCACTTRCWQPCARSSMPNSRARLRPPTWPGSRPGCR